MWLSQGLGNSLEALVASLSKYHANNKTGAGLYVGSFFLSPLLA